MAVSLKTQNIPAITAYAIWCLSLYAVFLSGDKNSWQNITSYFEGFTAKDGMVAALFPIIVFVLCGILSADIKAIIVFWRIKNPLPGSRVFTELGPKDARVDMNKIEQIIGTIPTEPKEQNSLWYKHFKKFQEVMNTCTQKYSCLVVDRTKVSSDSNDSVYWYRAPEKLQDIHLGGRNLWKILYKTKKRLDELLVKPIDLFKY